MESEPREKLLRVQGPLSTSGCQTCKQRHIKCDEGRPQCQRCLKAGRLCGYVAGEHSNPSTKFIIYAAPRELSSTTDLSDLNKRALHYFRCRAVLQMTGPLQSELWKDCIFQLAEGYDFVMSALVALSCLHESYSQDADARNRLQANAIQQYNKTIRDISQASEPELPVDALLMTVAIFHSLESLRGCFQRALQHAQSGIKILGERLQAQGTHQQSIFAEALYRNFLALQNQVREFGNSTISKAFDAFKGFQPPPSDYFYTIEQATYHLDVIYNEIYCLVDYCQMLQESNIALADVFLTEIQPRFEIITTRFRCWKRGIEHLEGLLDTANDSRQNQACLLLRIYESLFAAMINSFPAGDCFDRFDADLAKALGLVEVFLKSQHHDLENASTNTFSLSLGVIPVLFSISWRSNDKFLRNKSLDLLRLSDRREGVWDSKVAFQLAQRYIAVKDQLAIGQGYLSSQLQISEIGFDSETTCRMSIIVTAPGTPPAGGLLPFEGFLGERRHVEFIQLAASN